MIDPRVSLPQRFESQYVSGAIKSEYYTFVPTEPHSLKDGDEVVVRILMSGFYVAELKSAVIAREHEARLQRENLEGQERERKRRIQEEGRAFNAYLAKVLPFKWSLGINDVLSGLSESSNGDGRNKKTVMHIRLLENFKMGRLKRSESDFLCGRNGKNWSGQADEKHDERVTCKECLKIADRLAMSDGEPEE